jgi:hypothetical protein
MTWWFATDRGEVRRERDMFARFRVRFQRLAMPGPRGLSAESVLVRQGLWGIVEMKY